MLRYLTMVILTSIFLAGAQADAAQERYVEDLFYLSEDGEMGDLDAVDVDEIEDPDYDPVWRITYDPEKADLRGWAGVYWLYPEGNWGDHSGVDLSGSRELSFYAKGKEGGEPAEFLVGGIVGSYSDSVNPALSTGIVTLEDSWHEYSIPLSGESLKSVIGGFGWQTGTEENPGGCVIYVADMKYK